MELEIWLGDITTLDVDAVVNAANPQLAPGGGVCGAIHAAAGPGLAEECRRIGGCATGDAKVTGGHGLPARWIVHAVGPVWQGGDASEVELLASAYRRAVEEADALGATSIAFPAISTGIYGMPLDLASETAVGTLARLEPRNLRRCVLVAFDDTTRAALEAAVAAVEDR